MASMENLVDGHPVLRSTVLAHEGGTTSVSFSPDGSTLVTGGYDCSIRLWDALTGDERLSLAGHRRGHVAFSPDGAWLISGGLHAEAQVIETATWQVQHLLEATGSIWDVAFTLVNRRPLGCTVWRRRLVLWRRSKRECSPY